MICRFGRLAVFCAVLLSATLARADGPSVAELGKAALSGPVEKRLEAIDGLTNLGAQAKAAVPQLLQALTVDDAAVRWHAARALGAIGPAAADAVPKLTAALADKDFHVRSHSAYALRRIGVVNKNVTAGLIALVTDEHSNVRRQAIEALSALDPQNEQVAQKISEALSAAETPVALAAVKSLAAYGEKALPAAIGVLKKSEPKSKSRYWACVLLQEFGAKAKDAVDPLSEALTDPDPTIRMQAALALGQIGPDAAPAVPALSKTLTDKLEAVQYASAYALGLIGSKEAVPALKKAAASKDALVKLLATWAIAKDEPDDTKAVSKAVDEIVAAMENERPEVRQAAAKALWDLKPPHEKLGPALSKALNDDDPEIVNNVIDSLASLGAKIAPRINEALKDEKRRGKALAIVQRMGPEAKDCVPQLVEMLAEKEEDLKVGVLTALSAIGPAAAEAVPAISKSLSDDSDRVNSAACIALGHIGSAAESAVPAIDKLLKSKSVYAQAAAAWSLAQIQKDHAAVAKKVLPLMIKSLKSPVELVRLEAAETLGSLGPAAKSAVPDLKQATADPSAAVSRSAKTAIERIEKKAIK
jgi:HEAT repeat protein